MWLRRARESSGQKREREREREREGRLRFSNSELPTAVYGTNNERINAAYGDVDVDVYVYGPATDERKKNHF